MTKETKVTEVAKPEPQYTSLNEPEIKSETVFRNIAFNEFSWSLLTEGADRANKNPSSFLEDIIKKVFTQNMPDYVKKTIENLSGNIAAKIVIDYYFQGGKKEIPE